MRLAEGLHSHGCCRGVERHHQFQGFGSHSASSFTHGSPCRSHVPQSVEPAEAEPHGSLMLRAQGPVHPGGAVGTGAGGNSVVLRQRVRHLAGIVVSDIQRHHRRPGSGKIAVDRYAGNGGNPLIKPAHEGFLLLPDGLHAHRPDIVQRGGQPCDAVAVESPRLQPCGQLLRLGGVVGSGRRCPHPSKAGGQRSPQTQSAGSPCSPIRDLCPVKQSRSSAGPPCRWAGPLPSGRRPQERSGRVHERWPPPGQYPRRFL